MGEVGGVGIRTLGVEEELMLVDPLSGRLSQRAARVLRGLDAHRDTIARGDEQIEPELFQSQIETNSSPAATLAELRQSLRRARRVAIEAAENADCRAVAVATPVLGFDKDEQRATRKARYQHIADEYADTSAIVCGMHVHVSVAGDEAVPVLDRLRPWLPVILAISANSPFYNGRDTGHASWRSQVWGRWPTAGPAEPFGDIAGYRAATDALVDTGAAMDRGMLYLDARIAEHYPTVEIRVADVCTDPDVAVLTAALCRGLVSTEAARFEQGGPVPAWRTDLLRASRWRAARYGLSRDLVHPLKRDLASSREVVDALIEYVGDALDETRDREQVVDLVERLFATGTGATRQRSVVEATGSLEAVVHDLRDRTATA